MSKAEVLRTRGSNSDAVAIVLAIQGRQGHAALHAGNGRIQPPVCEHDGLVQRSADQDVGRTRREADPADRSLQHTAG